MSERKYRAVVLTEIKWFLAQRVQMFRSTFDRCENANFSVLLMKAQITRKWINIGRFACIMLEYVLETHPDRYFVTTQNE